jgi:hypothetical protein
MSERLCVSGQYFNSSSEPLIAICVIICVAGRAQRVQGLLRVYSRGVYEELEREREMCLIDLARV